MIPRKNGLQRQELIQSLDQFKSIQIIHFAPYQPLEDTQQTLDLSAGSDLFSAPHEQRPPNPCKGRDVAALFPQSRREEGVEQSLIGFWKALGGWVEFE